MRKKVIIIGAGPSALFLASFLDANKFQISIYDKNKAAGRKFLVAGKGGFNLSHSENINSFIERYTPSFFLKEALLSFSNVDLVNWLKKIGISTYVGSSNRIFPEKGIKPIEVLQAILKDLDRKKVKIHYQEEWIGWKDSQSLYFDSGKSLCADYCVFALGGASWNVTGSDGKWLHKFSEKGILTKPFRSSNCAFQILWPKSFLEKAEGKPLKNISISCGALRQKGEVVITQFGLEGNAIYALSPEIQEQLALKQEATIYIDLKPSISKATIINKMQNSIEKNISDRLRKTLKLSAPQIGLLKIYISKKDFLDINILSRKIKELPMKVLASAKLDEAISTTGGIDLNEMNRHYELTKMKDTFCIGEMTNWTAPTGGYLLQGCFSMGVFLAKHLNQK